MENFNHNIMSRTLVNIKINILEIVMVMLCWSLLPSDPNQYFSATGMQQDTYLSQESQVFSWSNR